MRKESENQNHFSFFKTLARHPHVQACPGIVHGIGMGIGAQLARPGTQPPTGWSSALPPLSDLEQSVLAGMDVYPVHIDQLARRLKMQIGPLSSTLSQLELKGAIRQEPGKNFVRCKG